MLRPIDRRITGRRLVDERITGRRIDVGGDAFSRLLKREASPLLLLPMRLEYRFVPASGVNEINRTALNRKIESLGDIRAGARTGRSGLRRDRNTRRQLASLRTNTSLLKPGVSKKVTGERLYIRWYPDEAFSEKGIAPLNADEKTALTHLNSRLGGKPWWDFSDDEVATAWQEFTSSVGIERGIYLKRTEGQAPDANWEARIGRITGLPAKVAVFTLTKSKLQLLVEGTAVPKNEAKLRSAVSYTPEALSAGNWLHDFNVAIKQGMGVRITDAAKIKQAKAADWTIAVGLSADKGIEEIETLLGNRIATGEFEFLKQDTPTNNSSAQPSSYKQFQNNALDYTRRATDLEQSPSAGAANTAALMFADALGIETDIVRQAIHSNDAAFEDAKAMLTVIGPALLDAALDGTTTLLDGVSENEFIEVLAASIVSRGALPSFRLGSNPYGVLPMTDVRQLVIPERRGESGEEKKVQEFLQRIAANMRGLMPGLPDTRVPVIKPDDESASSKLESILMSTRAGARVEVTEGDSDTRKPIGCPYVQSSQARKEHQVANYLRSLRTQPINKLADPTASDVTWPLLYRLSRVALERNTFNLVAKSVLSIKERAPIVGRLTSTEKRKFDQAKKQTGQLTVEKLGATTNARIRGLQAADLKIIQKANKQFAEALMHLEAVASREEGVAELEMLLIEVIDLFQHRVDALATGLAFSRIQKNRAAGQKGLNLGYFAMLSKLRTKSVDKKTNSYIQAPSQAQATTAAVLRSAYLRHKAEGAFEINLSSRRVKRALALLDLLSKGHSLAEALGMRGERWLHENKLDKHLYPLRQTFPITTAEKGATARRMFDGLALLDSSTTTVNGFNIKTLRNVLSETLDTLSDLVMAEATHQRAMGQSGAANAWLQVLSGATPPGIPSVVRTQREGHATEYRVSVVMPPGKVSLTGSARQIGEPGLFQFATDAIDGLGNALLSIRALQDDGNPGPQVLIRVKRDLNFNEIDLLVGGWEELEALARAHMLNRLRQESDLLSTLNAASSIQDFESGTARLIIAPAGQGPDIRALADDAETIRRIISQSRTLEPTDLNAASDALAGQLTEAERIEAEEHACSELKNRVMVLHGKLLSALNGMGSTPGMRQLVLTYQTSVNAYVNALDAQAGNPEVQRAEALQALGNLCDKQLGLVSYGCRAALQLSNLTTVISDPDGEFARLDRLLDELDRKRAVLEAATGVAVNGFSTYSQAKAARDTLTSAIKASLDGEAFTVLLPMRRASNKARPVLAAKQSVTAALGHWTQTRLPVGEAVNLATYIDKAKAANVKSEAWDDERALDAEDQDPRPENLAPRSEHRATFIGENALLSSNAAIAGLVIDEWVDQRPSATQEAALAVNYDTPQAEPPNVTLLCTPPDTGLKQWSEENAAAMVVETIVWMKIRALTSEDRVLPRSFMPDYNQVAFKDAKVARSKRIPTAKPRFLDTSWLDAPGKFKTVSELSLTEAQKQGHERAGYRYSKE